MRRVGFLITAIVLIVAAYGLGRSYPRSQTGSNTGARTVLYYVDPMHPAYRSDKPGIAPDCGMRLEPVYAGSIGNTSPSPAQMPASAVSLPAGAVTIDGATRQLLGIRLASAERSGASHTVRVVGRVTPEDTRIYRVNSGVDGFVRQTYNDAVGTLVRKNQKLASCYAPEFISAASGFLAANERVPGSVSKEGARSIQNYSDRLRNLGMGDVQIKQMADTRQLADSIDVVSPADGFILARTISPGQHFSREKEFYTIADLSRVWVVAEVSEQEASSLRPGSSAQLTLRGEKVQLSARVTDSLPQSEAGGGTVKLRLEVTNPHFRLRPEMLVDVELPVRMASAVTIPLDALIDSGASARVYVEHRDGVFEPREVQTGWRVGDRVEILHGVQPGERVVASATFLVDSESRLKAPASRLSSVPEHMIPASAQRQGS